MKKILITGASGDIGKSIAELFSEKGYMVYAGYNKNKINTNLYTPIHIDVTDRQSIKDAIECIGGVDILVNNAGISEQKLFCDISSEDWDKMFSVNVKGAFLAAQEAIKYMLNKKWGRIINIASIWGENGASMEVHYSASKSAIIGFTKALAKELAPSGINVNCVSPGMIDTKMNAHLSKEDIAMIEEEIPLLHQGSCRDVAEAVYFLAGEGSDYITGQIISVSGGWNI